MINSEPIYLLHCLGNCICNAIIDQQQSLDIDDLMKDQNDCIAGRYCLYMPVIVCTHFSVQFVIAQYLVFFLVFCRSLFVLLLFFFFALCCLSFLDLWILIAPLVSSKFLKHNNRMMSWTMFYMLLNTKQ